MGVNTAAVALLAAGTFAEYRASGFHPSAQLTTSVAGNLALIALVGIAQAAACCWAFSYIRIVGRNRSGMIGSLLGLLSGPIFVLSGVFLTNVRDIGSAVWIFAPTGIVFGWLVAASQADRVPQVPLGARVKEVVRPALTVAWKRILFWKMSWRLTLWWMGVNTAGLTVAVGLTQIEVGFLPRGALLFLSFMAALGVLQSLVGGLLISFLRMKNKILRIALGIVVGFVAAIAVMFASAFAISYYVVVGFWVFIPSGILFGWLLAAKRRAG